MLTNRERNESVLETLEPRLLLSADVLSAANVASSRSDPLTAIECTFEEPLSRGGGAGELMASAEAAVEGIFDAATDWEENQRGEATRSTQADSASGHDTTTGPDRTEQRTATAEGQARVTSALVLGDALSPAAEAEVDLLSAVPESAASGCTALTLTETLKAANGPPEEPVWDEVVTQRRRQVRLLDTTAPGGGPGAGRDTIGTPQAPQDEVWSGGEKYSWDLQKADGTEGEVDGWDTVVVEGKLTINATSDNPFLLDVNSVDLVGVPAPAEDFSNGSAYSWRIVHTTGGIEGFDRSKFDINPNAFAAQQSLGTGAFLLDVSSNGRDLLLRFVPDLPWAVSVGEEALWLEQGPWRTVGNSNTDIPPDDPVVGAVQVVAVHPTDPNVAYLGAVSGGVWKSVNFGSANPTWVPVGDQLPTLAISALAISPHHPDTVFVGTGSVSSAGKGGLAKGVFRSTDGGLTWQQVAPPINGAVVTAIAVSDTVDGLMLFGTRDNAAGSLWRSTDNGDHWDVLTGGGGLPPTMPISDIVQEPGHPGRFYVAVSGLGPAVQQPGEIGVYRSDDLDQVDPANIQWTQKNLGLLPDFNNNGLRGEPADPANNILAETLDNAWRIRLAVSGLGNKPVYAAILGANPSLQNNVMLAGVFRSSAAGDNWQPLGGFPQLPQTNLSGQGLKHFAMATDPLSDERLYIAGVGYKTPPYTGNGFRWDGDTQTWNAITSDGGLIGIGKYDTVPHADARNLFFSSNFNDLLVVNDGGIYRLSNPRADNPSPAWTFIGNGLRIAEISTAVAYDHNTNSVFAGTQDTGVVRQTADPQIWQALTGGDGNFVGIGYDGTTSTRYYMSNNFNSFFRRNFTNPADPDADGVPIPILLRASFNPLPWSGLDDTPLGTLTSDREAEGYRHIPFAINVVDPESLLIGSIMLYASDDQGGVIRTVSAESVTNPPTAFITALTYGGFEGTTPRADIMWVVRGKTFEVSANDGANFKRVTVNEVTGKVGSLAIDPTNWRSAFAVDGDHLWHLEVTGSGEIKAEDITGSLGALTAGLRSVEVWRSGTELFIAVGAADGVYWLSTEDLQTSIEASPVGLLGWARLGQGFPNVVVADLAYDATDDVLVAGTQGRGAWLLPNASRVLSGGGVLRIDTGPTDDLVRIRLAAAATGPAFLEVLMPGNVLERFELSSIQSIEVHTGEGDDTLVIDSIHGEVVTPGGIRFDGGPQTTASPGDALRFEGPVQGGLETATKGDTEIRQMGAQVVAAVHVETFTETTFFEDFVSFWRDVWDKVAGFFERVAEALTPDAPVIGEALGPGLNGGDFAAPQPIGFPAGDSVPQTLPGSAGDTSSFWHRLFNATGGFNPQDLGQTILTSAELQSALDAMDSIPNNVSVVDPNDPNLPKKLVLGDLVGKPFRRTIAFEAPVNLEILGGLVRIHGSIELAADVELMLEMGRDQRGFYLATNASGVPEVTVRNLRVNGFLTATGTLGLLEVKLDKVTLDVGDLVGFGLDIVEPDDPYDQGDPVHPGDGDTRIRLYELLADPASLFAIKLLGDPGDDLVLEAWVRVAGMDPSGPPLFDLPLAQLRFIWADIAAPLSVRVEPVGGPAEFLYRFLNFRVEDLYVELRRTLTYFENLSQSAFLDVSLPFGAGLSLGASFDFATAYLDRVFSKLVDTEVVAGTGSGKPSSLLAQGRLGSNAVLQVVVDDAAAVTVTVTKASTDTGLDANASLNDLVVDFNEALSAAGLGSKVAAVLDKGQLALRLLSGLSLKVTAEAGNAAVTELGFPKLSTGAPLPKLPTLQSVVATLNTLLDPDGPGPATAELKPRADLAKKTFALDLSFTYGLSKTTPFKFDPNLGLGELAEVVFAGEFGLNIGLEFVATLGVDFNAGRAPRLQTAVTLPPPSSGRIEEQADFTINLNDGRRYPLSLTTSLTDPNTSLADLVADLNSLLGPAAGKFNGKDLNQVLRFVSAGNSIVLEAINEDANGNGRLDAGEDANGNGKLDLEPNGVFSIAIEADSDDPTVTEIGFSNIVSARSASAGVFLENVALGGTLTVSASNLQATARFGIFGLETSGGSATGTATALITLKNPSDGTTRIDLDELLSHLSDLTAYLQPSASVGGTVTLTLPNIKVTPNLSLSNGDDLEPEGAALTIFIPDIRDVTYNPLPYDPVLKNKGLFVTYPDFGPLLNFRCSGLADVVSLLDQLSDQLEGLQAFSFLNDPLPLINVSVGDVLDFAGEFARTIQSLSSGDGETLDQLEAELEDLLGVSDGALDLSVDDATPAAITASGQSRVFNPAGRNNAIKFTSTGVSNVRFLFEHDTALAGNAAVAAYDNAKGRLTVRYNAGQTTAATIVAAVKKDVTDKGIALTAGLDNADAGNTGAGTVTVTALKLALNYHLGYGDFLPLQFSLGDLVALLPAGPAKDALAGVASLVQITGSATINVTASADFTLQVGVDVSDPCHWRPFIYDATGVTLAAAVRGTDLAFQVGIGSLGVFVVDGTVTLDGDGDPATPGDAQFAVTFKDNNGDGRHYFDEPIFDLSNVGVTFAAGASARLPLYFPTESIPVDGKGDANHDGYPDNELVVGIASVADLFEGDTSGITVITPDIAGLFDDINVCDLITHPEILVDGLDALLAAIQEGLGNEFVRRNLPLVGPELGKAADFIGDFRAGFLAGLRAKLVEVGDPISLAQEAIYNSLGAPGLDILVKSDGSPLTAADQVEITCEDDEVRFHLRLKKSIALVDTTGNPIAFNIGLDDLGLKVHANVLVEVGFDLKLNFAISVSDGFYLDTSDPEELRLDFNVTVPGLSARADLFFLQLDVSDEADGKDLKGNPREPSHFTGYFAVDLKDPVGGGDRLTFADLISSGFDAAAMLEADLGAEAVVNLDLAISFDGDARFPRLVAEFDLDWSWSVGGDGEGELTFGFHNFALDLGQFISKFAKPVLQEIHKITEPFEPIITLITTPLPLISDIAGKPYTLLDMAELWGVISPDTRRFIDVVIVIAELADAADMPGSSLLLPLGDLNLELDGSGNVGRKAGDLDTTADLTEGVSDDGFLSFLQPLKQIGITFPFLSTSELFKLIRGQPISLIEYHLPVLDFEAAIELAIPILGPLYVKFGGSIRFYADLTIGFDTYGLQKFFASEDKNVLDIFDGFYVKDVDAAGNDVPEFTISGELHATGSIDVVVAEAGVRGGIEAIIDFNLNDPDDDGRVRISEIIANAKKDIRCIFDIHGEIAAFLEAFVEVHLLFIDIDETWRFAEITLVEFDITCPVPILANYTDLAGNELDAPDASGILRLNLGDYAGEREVEDTTDGHETFLVKSIEQTAQGETVEVSYGGIKQTYTGVKAIWAHAGKGNDTVDLRGVTSPVLAKQASGIGEILGGDGDDTFYAGQGGGVFRGGDGDDTITAEPAEGAFLGVVDQFYGDAGDDVLTGLEGSDKLFGGDGNDTLSGGDGDDQIEGGKGRDLADGGPDNDIILGGPGADLLHGQDGLDVINGEEGDDTITGGRGDDSLVGGADDDVVEGGSGNDILLGDLGTIVTFLKVTGIAGTGNDTLSGGPGGDVIFAAGGKDAVFGGTAFVSGQSEVTGDAAEIDGVDFIDAGDGDDVVFADDAHSAQKVTFPGANVGDTVWFEAVDASGQVNGQQDPRESGVAQVKVELYDAATNAKVSTTYTDAAGVYRFTGLGAGDYYLKFYAPSGLAFTTLHAAGVAAAADSDADDADNDGVAQTASFHLDAGDINDTIDAGLKGTKPVITVDDVAVTEGDTGLVDLVFTVSLSSPSSAVVTVCYRTEELVPTGDFALDSTHATHILDYVSGSWTLVFQPGETVKQVVIPIRGDVIDEPNQTFHLALADAFAGLQPLGIAKPVGIGTIVDDDDAPQITVDDSFQDANGDNEPDAWVTDADGDGVPDSAPIPETAPVKFVIRLSRPSYRDILVHYQVGPVVGSDGVLEFDGALEAVDYSDTIEPTPGTVVIKAGQTERIVQIRAHSDLLDEYDERFRLVIFLDADVPLQEARITDAEAFGRIGDDDATPFVRWDPLQFMPVTFDVQIKEGHAGTVTRKLKLRLTDEVGNPVVSGRPVTVNWNTTRGTAVSVATPTVTPDFTYLNDTVVFDPGQNQVDVEVEVVGDLLVELPHEYFFANILTAVNGQIDVTENHLNHAQLTILDDESGDPGPWYVEFSHGSYAVLEGETAIITLVRPPGSSEPVAVYWSRGAAATPGVATPGADYLGIWESGSSGSRGIVSFGPDETTKSFTIATLQDYYYEGDETVSLFLANPTGGPVRSLLKTATLVIQDNDPLPQIIIDDSSATENDGGSDVFIEFVVTAVGKAQYPVSVKWQPAEGTATGLDDVVLTALASLSFSLTPADPMDPDLPTVLDTETVKVKLKADNDAEVSETLHLRLQDAVNATIYDYEAEGTILDDDPAKVTGRVFFDLNGNGVFDESSEYGLPGVKVTVTDVNGANPSVVTTLNGVWTDPGVLLGDISIAVSETDPALPVGVALTSGDNPLATTVGVGDLDASSTAEVDGFGFGVEAQPGAPDGSIGNGAAYPNDTVYGGPGNDTLSGGGGDDWLVGAHWLGPGGACTDQPYDATLIDDGRKYVDPTKLPKPGTITGQVWLDNNDGSRAVGEPGLANIQVNLFDATWTLVAVRFTDAAGKYTFDKVAPYDYYVQFLPPAAYTFAPQDATSNDKDSDASPTTGLTAKFTVAQNATVANVDAGFVSVPPGGPGPWSVQFSQLIFSVRESDGFATIFMTATPGSIEPVGVYYTLEGTATHGADYLGIWEALDGGTRRILSFGPGELLKSFTIPVFEDAVAESPETVLLRLRNPTGGSVTGNLPAATLLIFDSPCPDNDVIFGGDGNDVILGDFGYFNAGLPVLLNGMGRDTLYGEAGQDSIFGEGDNDVLDGGAHNDQLDGGSENDTYRFDGDLQQGQDTVTESATLLGGSDTVDLSATHGHGVALDLALATPQDVTDYLKLTLPANVLENLIGGSRDDLLRGNGLDNTIDGQAGDDVLEGFAGNDHLIGGPGDDTFLFDADGTLGHDDLTEVGGTGRDLIDFRATTTLGVAVDLAAAWSQAVNANLSLTLSDATGVEDLYGTNLADALLGNDRNNVIWGFAGNDMLEGRAGTDTMLEERPGSWSVFDGAPPYLLDTVTLEKDLFSTFENVKLVGDDSPNVLNASSFSGIVILDGKGGNDTLIGGSGSNLLTGGPGSDLIDGSLGLDTLIEEADADMLLTDTALANSLGETDTFIGTIEFASLTGGDSANLLDASAYSGRVILAGGGGGDTLIGSAQADILVGDAGDDTLEGRDGNDWYVFDADSALGFDRINETPGGGMDLITFAPTTAFGVTVSLATNASQTVNANLRLKLSASDVIEHLTGSAQADTLVGNVLANRIDGGPGDDSLTGSTGNDELIGGAGADRLIETRDAPLLVLTTASFVVGAEVDSLTGIEQATLTGGPAANTLHASGFAGEATLLGLGANDLLFGGPGNDVLEGGAGDDTLNGGLGGDSYRFDADSALGADTIVDAGGMDRADFTATSSAIAINLGVAAAQPVNASLTLTGASALEIVLAGAGNDLIIGNASINLLDGGPGNDALHGLGGIDLLAGGPGDDTYVFDADGPLGMDYIVEQVGGGGTDTLDFSASAAPVSVNLGVGHTQVVNPNLSLTLLTCHSIENLVGGNGPDILRGNTLANRITGGPGNDQLTGDWGNDTYVFDADLPTGNDKVFEVADTDGGIDTLDYSPTGTASLNVNLTIDAPQAVSLGATLELNKAAAIENLLGGGQSDLLTGNAAANVIHGHGGADILSGGDGPDELQGGPGNDQLAGGLGDDHYLFDADAPLGSDTLTEAPGAGTDTLDFSATTGIGITLHLGLAGAQVVNANLTLALVGTNRVENAVGGSGDDTFSGNELNNTFSGGPGNDRYLFDADLLSGSDTIVEATGAAGGKDTLDFSATAGVGVVFDLALATPQIIRQTVNPVPPPDVNTILAVILQNPDGLEAIVGGAKADKLLGNALDNDLAGGPGNDTLDGRDGVDAVVEARDANFILKNPTLQIGSETDTLAHIEQARLTGGASPNTLDASGFTLGPVTLDGGLGNDTLRGGSSSLDRVVVTRDADMVLTDTQLKVGVETDVLNGIETATLTGGGAPNILDASAFTLGSVTLIGLGGADKLTGGKANDLLLGGPGNDVLTGGPGFDRVVEARGEDFVLTDASLKVGAAETDLLSSVEEAELTGGDGNEKLNASAFTLGGVFLHGGAGDDWLYPGTRAGLADGGAGTDLVIAAANLDFTLTDSLLKVGAVSHAIEGIEAAALTGGAGDNLLDASAFTAGPVLLLGEAGRDTLIGGAGNDVLSGGDQNDVYRFAGDWGNDQVVEVAGGGADTLDFSGANAGVVVTIGAAVSAVEDLNHVTHAGSQIERFVGSPHADTFHLLPSPSTPFTLDGGANPAAGEDVLNYDAMTLPTTQTATTLTTAGFATVTFANLEVVNLVNPDGLSALLARPSVSEPSAAESPRATLRITPVSKATTLNRLPMPGTPLDPAPLPPELCSVVSAMNGRTS